MTITREQVAAPRRGGILPLGIGGLVAALTFAGGWLLGGTARAAAGSRPTGQVVAEVDGRAITRSELEGRAAPRLRRLEQQRHQVLEETLAGVVEERLIAAEAEQRGVTPQEYLEGEIGSPAVTEEQVEAFYAENRQRIRQPREAVVEQIRAYLEQRARQEARQELLAALRRSHRVAVHLEPFRVDVEADGAPSRGPEDAPVTVVEFSDFQCPYCQRMSGVLDRTLEAYGDRVRLVFRQFPLASLHSHAEAAAEASLCARDQGRFWEMHDALFAHQRELGDGRIRELGEEVGLDPDRFAECLASGTHRETVEADLRAGQELGVVGTPTLFVNGRQVTFTAGSDPIDQLAAVVDDELGRAGVAVR